MVASDSSETNSATGSADPNGEVVSGTILKRRAGGQNARIA
jgi:hypothetical protein